MPHLRLVIVGWLQKAVISILAEVCGEDLQQKPNRKRKDKCVNTVSDVIMKQCRNVLHLAAAADKKMVFASLLGGSLNTSDNDDEGLLESPSMLSRPLDFRIIDMKLTSGAYGGSHEAFLEDVREVCSLLLHLFGSLIFNFFFFFFSFFKFLLLCNSFPVCIYVSKMLVPLYLYVVTACFNPR